MGSAVVNDEVTIEPFSGLLIDQPENVQEVTMTMAWHARPDDLAVQHVERREQRRVAVPLVVAIHLAGAALLHRRAALDAVEDMHLALFIDAENQYLVRRIEKESNYIVDLGGEVLVARDLEPLDEMGLEPMRAPAPLDARQGDARPHRHAAPEPMGRVRRFLAQRHVHHLLDLPRGQRRNARGPGHVLQKPLHPPGHIAPAPTAHGQRLLPIAVAIASAINPSLASSTIRALQTTFWGKFRLRASRSNRSRSALRIKIRSIVLIGPDSQV